MPARVVSRPAVIRRLADTQEAELAVVVAPPGYGKSTALADWAAHDERPFLWLSLDERNATDVATAVTSILEVFREAGWAEPLTVHANRTRVKGAPTDPLKRLMRQLDREDLSFVLVLDDVNIVRPRVLHEVVTTLLKNLPRGAMLAVASRREPALPLGRLRASGALAEVRADDLAMTPAEAGLMLRRAGLKLDPEAVQMLVRQTEGWPAGLYLAALSLRDEEDVLGALPRFGGDDYRVEQYFREEVFSALPKDLLSFSMRTSVLDELTGPLCDAVLEDRGSALTLIELAQASALLRPLDAAHERYRWHGLFRDALRGELRRSEPELEAELHRRASVWHETHDDMDRAIDHAISALDHLRAGDLLWANLVTYLTHGRNETVQAWLGRISPHQIADHVPLAVSAAYSSIAAGDADNAQRWSIAAAAALERARGGVGARSLGAGLAGLEAVLARKGMAAMADAAVRAYEQAEPDSPWRPGFLFLRGTALHLAGDRAEAKQLLQDGADLSAASAPSVTALCLAQSAMIAIEEHDWDLAAELTDRSERVIARHGLAADPMFALVFAAQAAARAHDGRADEAKRDLRAAIQLLASLGDFIPWYGAAARILMAHAALWLADIVAARTLLAEASRLARRTLDAVVFGQWFDNAWAHMDTLAETSLAGPSALTIAELRILRFLPSHRSFREIAAQLGVSANTVKTQAHAVYRKLGAASRSEAVDRALAAGLLGQ